MTRNHSATGTSRRRLLGALASTAATAVAGCGYRSAPGDRLWRWERYTDDDRVFLVDGTLLLLGQDEYDDDVYVNRLRVESGREADDADVSGRLSGTTVTDDGVLCLLDKDDPESTTVASVPTVGEVRTAPHSSKVIATGTRPAGPYLLTESETLVGVGGIDDELVTDGFEFDVASRYPSDGSLLEVAVSANGRGLAYEGADGRLHVRWFAGGERRFQFDGAMPAVSDSKRPDQSRVELEAVDDAVLVVGNSVDVIDARTGRVRASVPAPDGTATWAADGGAIYVVVDETLHAFDGPEHSKRWSYEGNGDRTAVNLGSGLAVLDGGVVFQSGETVVELAREDGSVRWRRSLGERVVGASNGAVVLRNGSEFIGRRH